MASKQYIGRFAPTPSGPLHFGSIVAALGSYLQARKQQGKWLVRIDDADTTRSRQHSDSVILNQLETLGLRWDDEVIYQSRRYELYQNALSELINKGLIYACQCSRREIGRLPYSGKCRHANLDINFNLALRLKTEQKVISINDILQKSININIENDIGDIIIRRADQLFAYHLATIVDDAEQQITEIVRGADLYKVTPIQIYLQQILALPVPDYMHLPVAVDANRKKISKSDQPNNLIFQHPEQLIIAVLKFLGQPVPQSNDFDNLDDLLQFAIQHWQIDTIPLITDQVI